MGYCTKCGFEFKSNQSVCLECGVAIRGANKDNDRAGFGWVLLGFCIPLVGLILFLVWKDEKPITAKSCITGAAISIVLGIGFYVYHF